MLVLPPTAARTTGTGSGQTVGAEGERKGRGAVYHPTTRVLTVLELLQARPSLSGPELAARLEVDVRTVRRYVTMLQDMGIPVEAERGRYGAYRLRPGFTLPPMMFGGDEALALILSLLAARRLGLGVAASALEGALAKVDRVLPEAARERARAVQDALVWDGAEPYAIPDAYAIAAFSLGTRLGRLVRLRYRSWRGDVTERDVEPYGVAYRAGFWYAAGYCRLRRDVRVFRLDRVLDADVVAETFEPPEGFDTLGHVLRSLAMAPGAWEVEVLLHAPIEEARVRVPSALAVLEPAPGGGTVLRCRVQQLGWVAHFLLGLGWPMEVRRPAELRDEFRALSERAACLADGAA